MRRYLLAALLLPFGLLPSCSPDGRQQEAGVDRRYEPPRDTLPDSLRTTFGPVPLEELVSVQYPPGMAEHNNWFYRREQQADLDKDGELEKVIVTAPGMLPKGYRGKPSAAPDSLFFWDDGQPWQVWIEEPQGDRTYIFSNWVQLGRIAVTVGEGAMVMTRYQSLDTTRYAVQYLGARAATIVALPGANALRR